MKMNIKEKLYTVRRAFTLPYVALPIAALLSLGLSMLIELIGIRQKLKIGTDGISPLAVTIGALFLFAAALTLIYARREDFDHRSSKQLLITLTVLAACVLICFSGLKNVGDPIKYPLTKGELEYQNVFVKQFDAFKKGQLHLDLYVSGRLAAMEDPYDTAEREKLRIPYHWDHAFFEGRYYSYFGLAPIFAVYYPYYFLTGALPGTVMVCAVFAIGALAALFFALRELVIFLGAKPPFWLYLAALPSAAFAIGIFTVQSYADFYYVPVASAIFFNCLFYFLALRGIRARSRVAEAALLGAAALAFVFSVMSRPTAALICLALAPALFHKFFLDKTPIGVRLTRILPFGAVALAGAAFIMWFNYARFGSPLDFGANYQLTVSDVSKNTIDLALLPASLFHYFLQPPTAIERFPYIGPSFIELGYPRYTYVEKTLGVLFFPISIGLFVCPFFYRVRERLRTFRTRDNTRPLVILCGAVITVALAFADFCKAGVNMRYLYDILPLVILLGTAMLLRFAGDAEEGHRAHRSLIAISAFGISALSGLSIVLENYWDLLFAFAK